MGAKSWMLVTSTGNAGESLADNPGLDRETAQTYASGLFPHEQLVPLEDGDLYYTNPPSKELFVGAFGDVKIIAAEEFGIDYPSRLAASFIPDVGFATLHAMHSVVDWFAFAHWCDGRLVRSLSLSPDSGMLEDIGARLAFEEPYWGGDFPAVDDDEDDYPFPFHPLDLGEATLKHFFGYQIEGYVSENLIDPLKYPLLHFRRSRTRSFLKFLNFWR